MNNQELKYQSFINRLRNSFNELIPEFLRYDIKKEKREEREKKIG